LRIKKNLPGILINLCKPQINQTVAWFISFILLFTFYPYQLDAQQSGIPHNIPPPSSVQQWRSITIDSLFRVNEILRGHSMPVTPGEINNKKSGLPGLNLPGAMRKPDNIQNMEVARNINSGNICYTISGRDFLFQDSIVMFTGPPTLTADGNVIVSGEFADYSQSPLFTVGGFCMKTDLKGNVIWAKVFDSLDKTNFDFLNFFNSTELKNGNILLSGRTLNSFSKNNDFILAMLNKEGDLLWHKTYESKFWQGFNGSGDYFFVKELEEDTYTGEIYVVGNHWFGKTTIIKLSPSDGNIIWSNAYITWDSDYPFGIVINSGNLILFQLGNGYNNESYIQARVINKISGDILTTKQFSQTGDPYLPRLFNTFQVVKQNNGRYLLSGATTGYTEFPSHTGTKDLYHAGVIELDENLEYVKAYGFKNRLRGNGYNTKISLFPDGTGVFTVLNYISSYTGEAQVTIFNNEVIYHQRKRLHNNEGIPNEPFFQQLPDGGFLNIKLLGDSTKKGVDGSKIDYYRMYSSDTASVCMGVKDSSTSIWHFNFEPASTRFKEIDRNVFKESRVKTYSLKNFTATPEPACRIISHCDLLAMKVSASKICPGTSVVVTIHKNKACGSLVPLEYDTSWVKQVTRLTDTTFTFHFDKPGKGFIRGSLMGCILHRDSVFIEVLPENDFLNLGQDMTLCLGNRITLNAGYGFASYKWQDGSADSTFEVVQPGKYYVNAVNGCGGSFSDTIIISQAPPIPFNAGTDRIKCNTDTIQLTAPQGFINYKWTNSVNNNSLNTQSVIVNPSSDTRYFISAEKTAGCYVYDTVFVKVIQSPDINLGIDTSFCNGQTVTFDAGNVFAQYNWSTSSTNQQINVNEKGRYTVIGITSEGCKSYDTVHVVQVYNNPVINLPTITGICSGTSKELNAGNYASYQWNTGSTSSSITVTGIGTYAVTVTDMYGCKGSDTIQILQLHSIPTNFLPADTAICSYSSILLKPTTSFSRYLWSNNSSSSSITVTSPGSYSLQVTDNNNCTGKESIIVHQKDCMKGFHVPSAFTPNGDGKNDVFRPMLFGNVKKYVFTIYNRWGQIIFQTTDINKGWDGKVAMEQQPNFVFVWTCRYLIEGESEKFERGIVTLIR
jgi:gliding motility-associated-like protein